MGDAAAAGATDRDPVAYDFRSADVAAGGQGAPLAPLYHAALAVELEKPLAVLNIGGVAQRHLDRRRTAALLAFDTGPATARSTIGCAAYRRGHDCDGALAAAGRVGCRDVARLLAASRISRVPRRNRWTGWISPPRWPPADRPVARRRRRHPGRLHGRGGRRAPTFPAPPALAGLRRRPANPAIMAALRCQPRCAGRPVEVVGWDGDALEAQCFGFLPAGSPHSCR